MSGVFMVMRAGVQVCSAFARGPRPPVEDIGFAFDKNTDGAPEGYYKVLHDSGDAFVCYGGKVDIAWDDANLLTMPETCANRDIELFLAEVKLRGLRNDQSLIGDVLCKSVLDSVGADSSTPLDDFFWSLIPGYCLETFPSLAAAEAAGLTQ